MHSNYVWLEFNFVIFLFNFKNTVYVKLNLGYFLMTSLILLKLSEIAHKIQSENSLYIFFFIGIETLKSSVFTNLA